MLETYLGRGRARAKLDSHFFLVPDFEQWICWVGGVRHSYTAWIRVVQQHRNTVHDRDTPVPRAVGVDPARGQWRAEAPPMYKVLAHHVPKLVRAHLVKDVKHTLVGEDSVYVIDGSD